nr:reverse transcriptase domain-containing protein [Tanacetum cinerariifolium]
MEITTTTGMVGTMGVPTRDFRHVALRSMKKREARDHEAAIGMTWNDFKALLVEEFYPSNEMERFENEFWNHKMVGANLAAYTDWFHELAKLVPHLNEIMRAGILTDEVISCDTLSKINEKRKAVEETSKSGGSWRDKKKAKMGAGCVLTVKNQAILLKIAGHRLEQWLCIVNPGYVIEVADGKKVEVDSIIRDCKLELGSSLFSINLIPLGNGSLDVIVGMDWLSQNKVVIVCHEKVVEIPLEDGRTLRVHGERAVGITKALMNAKSGIHMDPGKIEAVKNWNAPMTSSEIQLFLGLV